MLLNNFSKGLPLTLETVHSDSVKEIVLLSHSYNANQIEWFKAGAALNIIRAAIGK